MEVRFQRVTKILSTLGIVSGCDRIYSVFFPPRLPKHFAKKRALRGEMKELWCWRTKPFYWGWLSFQRILDGTTRRIQWGGLNHPTVGHSTWPENERELNAGDNETDDEGFWVLRRWNEELWHQSLHRHWAPVAHSVVMFMDWRRRMLSGFKFKYGETSTLKGLPAGNQQHAASNILSGSVLDFQERKDVLKPL